MKSFIELTPEGKTVQIALNFHAYGNLLIHPFNYLREPFSASEMLKKSPMELKTMLSETLCSKDGENF